MGQNESPEPVIKVKRSRWKDGHYHTVARNEKGHMLAHSLWHSKETTVEVDRRAIYNIGRRKAIAPKEPAPLPPIRDNIALRRPVGSLHERYSITCKIITEYGSEWFVNVESATTHLSEVDKEYIKNRLLRDYKPKKNRRVYSETIIAVIPVVCRDIGLGKKGKKVVF
jgi:hypothetical protein